MKWYMKNLMESKKFSDEQLLFLLKELSETVNNFIKYKDIKSEDCIRKMKGALFDYDYAIHHNLKIGNK